LFYVACHRRRRLFFFYTPGQTSRACNVASDGNDGWCAMVINPSIPAARAVTQYALVVSIFIVRTERTIQREA
jgi:hypothetical protein